jgi:DNA-directed RNA polymerase specialized sigma24 family protein
MTTVPPSTDHPLLTEAIRPHLSRLYNWCLRLCGSESAAQALCEQTLTSADALPEPDLPALFRLAYELWDGTQKGPNPFFVLPRSVTIDGRGDVHLPDVEAADEADAAAEGDRLWVAIGALPKLEKAVLILVDTERFDLAAVAALLNRPVTVVRDRLGRAREGLVNRRQAAVRFR